MVCWWEDSKLTLTETLKNLEEARLNQRARMLKIMGDSNRQKILEILRKGEQCQCEIIPGINQSQPTVSRHLGLMEEVGILASRKEGTKVFYAASHDGVFEVLDWIDKIVEQSEGF
jgi:ArsR family transcriptional regulator